MVRLLLAFLLIPASTLPVRGEPRDHLKEPVEWFRSAAGRQRIEYLLSHQNNNGCWPKNIDTTVAPYSGKPQDLKGTFDNGATVDELRLLARAFSITESLKTKQAFNRGLQCILDAQYDNGGWPQSPQPKGYSQHITFNDSTMVGLMSLLREVFQDDRYDFVADKIRKQAGAAFDAGVQCILACQIKRNDVLSVWCAQHDRETFEPRGARSYEHPSLSGSESAGVVCLLMSLDNPSAEIQKSIRAAVGWFDESKLLGIRFDKHDGDRRVTRDTSAPPLWARFYELDTNRPIFSGRDGIIKYDVADIEAERRNGYSWYVNSGKRVDAYWSNWKWK